MNYRQTNIVGINVGAEGKIEREEKKIRGTNEEIEDIRDPSNI